MNEKFEFVIEGRIIDILSKSIFQGKVYIKNGIIEKVETGKVNSGFFICPGLIDAHIHIESSMLTPVEFARIAVNHGTVATVSDPHEIANVLGEKGIEYMIENGKKVPFKFTFGVPSCVPATKFETSGASLSSEQVKDLLGRKEMGYLAEMMNYPGVIHGDRSILDKINYARELKKPIDGHAPGLSGEGLEKYVNEGISTDHECTELNEAIEKLNLGMKILIREGSAANDFDNLYSLLDSHTDRVMLCSDDLHPDDLLKGHINLLIRNGISKGVNLFNLLQAAVINPANHYKLNVGFLQEGDPADFIVIDNPENFNVLKCFIDGIKVSENGETLINSIKSRLINNFSQYTIGKQDLLVPALTDKISVIEARDGELYTKKNILPANINNGYIQSDIDNDILKIVVVNRYKKAKPSVGFIRGFGIKHGAIASSIAHDSHNIIAIGVDDISIVSVVNQVMNTKGGIAAFDGRRSLLLPLGIAGIMSDMDCRVVAERYGQLNQMVEEMGTYMRTPFMTLSFMALLVIPELKIGDKGLFDVGNFSFTGIHVS